MSDISEEDYNLVEKWVNDFSNYAPHVSVCRLLRAYDALRAELTEARRQLAAQPAVPEAVAKVAIYEDALMKLATLGNEPLLGNSIGNVIAQDALTKGDAILSATATEGRKDE